MLPDSKADQKIHFRKPSQFLKEIFWLILEPLFLNASQSTWFWYLEIIKVLFWNTEYLPKFNTSQDLLRDFFSVLHVCIYWALLLLKLELASQLYERIKLSVFFIAWLQSRLIRLRPKGHLRILKVKLSSEFKIHMHSIPLLSLCIPITIKSYDVAEFIIYYITLLFLIHPLHFIQNLFFSAIWYTHISLNICCTSLFGECEK